MTASVQNQTASKKPLILEIGSLRVDLDLDDALIRGERLGLTLMELKVLALLVVFSPGMVGTLTIYKFYTGYENVTMKDANLAVKVVIWRIRQKLGAKSDSVIIESVRGVGYILKLRS